MAEDLDFIKMEIDEDEPDLLYFEELEDTKEEFFDILDDPLLMLTPIVYTTKLDDMKILKSDLKNSTPKEILKAVQSESQPTALLPTTKRRLQSTDTTRSFIELTRILRYISNDNKSNNEHNDTSEHHNLLQKQQNDVHNPTDNQRNEIQESQHNQCKPCSVVLKDIKYLLKSNQTVKLSMSPNINGNIILIGESDIIDDTLVKQELLQEAKEKDSVENRSLKSTSSDNESISRTTIEVKKQNSKRPHSKEPAKKLKTTDTSLDNSSSAPIRKRSRPSYVHLADDNEEDNVSLQTIKRKKQVVNTTNKASVSSFATLLATDVAQMSSIERYALVVLIQEKKKQAYVYRVNATKLVTDYFITKDFDEYVLASMYPKEEKFMETFCCWYKREEIIAKICSRKNYPYSIQKFMKQPHDCDSDDCDCCCRTLDNNNIQTSQSARRAAISNSIAIADKWIHNLLVKNSDSAVGLVSKAINYIRKVEKNCPRRKEKQPERYLENTLLCIKNTSTKTGGKTHFELYDIGKNGDVVKSLETGDEDIEYNFRRTYQFMSSTMREITDTESCCWFKREKIMSDLKTLNVSPTALKYIQKAHMCAKNLCFCCCKPKPVTLRSIEVLPETLNHTSVYEKDKRWLSVHFNKPMKPTNKTSGKDKKRNVYTNKKTNRAIASSACASKIDNPDESIDIQNTLKNVKLGVDCDGKIEAVLCAPAKNLSVAELKALSDIIDFSTKQINELAVTAEKFCDKVNSKSIEISRLIGPAGATLIRTLLSKNQGNDGDTGNNEDIIDIEIDTSAINETNRQTSNTDSTQNDKSEILNPSSSNETSKTTAILDTQSCNTKSISNIFLSLSSLMETKNKNYVDSLKSYFSHSKPLNAVIPELYKFSPLPQPVHKTALVDTNIEPDLSEESLPMPIIKETFTLAKPPTVTTYAKPGPSRTNPCPKEMSSNFETSITSIVESEIKQEPNTTNTQPVTMLRVKPVSELIDPNFTLSPPVTNNLLITPNTSWPTPPIVLNGTLEGNSMVRPNAPTIVTLRPDTQNQISVGQINSPINQYQWSNIMVSRSAVTGSNSSGIRYITLRPIYSQKVADKVNKTIVAQAVTPQVVSNATATIRGGFPQLVPIRCDRPKRIDVTKQNPKKIRKILKQNDIKKS